MLVLDSFFGEFFDKCRIKKCQFTVCVCVCVCVCLCVCVYLCKVTVPQMGSGFPLREAEDSTRKCRYDRTIVI